MYHFSAPRTSRKPSELLSLPRRLPPAAEEGDTGIWTAACVRGSDEDEWGEEEDGVAPAADVDNGRVPEGLLLLGDEAPAWWWDAWL